MARRFRGRRFVGLGFALLVFLLFAGDGGMVFKPITVTGRLKTGHSEVLRSHQVFCRNPDSFHFVHFYWHPFASRALDNFALNSYLFL
jgi:hypothetical protein